MVVGGLNYQLFFITIFHLGKTRWFLNQTNEHTKKQYRTIFEIHFYSICGIGNYNYNHTSIQFKPYIMKYFFKALRIIGFLFCLWLYNFGFDVFSCILSFALISFITFIEQKKSEAGTSDS